VPGPFHFSERAGLPPVPPIPGTFLPALVSNLIDNFAVRKDSLKRALTIVAAVAAYTVFEMLLLMSIAVSPDAWVNPSLYHWIVVLGQLLLIPGFAVLYSWAMFGHYHWKRRSLVILAIGTLCIPAVLIPFSFTVLLIEWIDPTDEAFGTGLVLLTLCGVAYAAFRFVRWMRRRGVRMEAEHWLTERQSGMGPREQRLRNRAVRWSLWIPSLSVLLLFLFFFEIWGALSHVAYRHANLPGYQLRVPLTWFIANYQQSNDETRLYGVTAKGPWRASGIRNLRAFAWSISTISEKESKRRSDYPLFIDKDAWREFSVGNESVTCQEEFLRYYDPWIGYQITSVKCSGSRGLRASFTGQQDEKAQFYKVLLQIRPTK
jgi:hypothetical protein